MSGYIHSFILSTSNVLSSAFYLCNRLLLINALNLVIKTLQMSINVNLKIYNKEAYVLLIFTDSNQKMSSYIHIFIKLVHVKGLSFAIYLCTLLSALNPLMIIYALHIGNNISLNNSNRDMFVLLILRVTVIRQCPVTSIFSFHL